MGSPRIARAWPMLSRARPPVIVCLAVSRNNRMRLVTVVRSLPVRCADLFMSSGLCSRPGDLALGPLDRIEIFALDVFDERNFQQPVVGEVLDDHRNFGQARQSSGPPAAFAGNQLISFIRAVRTIKGWMIPFARMDCASSFRRSAWKTVRGWTGLGSIASIGRRE